MTRTVRVLAMVLLGACNGGGTDGDDGTDGADGTDGTDGGSTLPDVTADLSCFTPAGSYDESAFLEQSVDAAKVVTQTLDGVVMDFQEDEPKGFTEVSLWFDDSIDGTNDVDASATTSNDDGDLGTLTLEAPSCQAMTYLALRDPLLEDAQPTYKAHQVYGFEDGGTADAEFVNVSTDSYLLIPNLLGVSPDPTKSIIAGTLYDCGRDPLAGSDDETGKVEGAWVEIKDADGATVEGPFIHYFFDDFPDRDLEASSEDGLYIIVDVPVGTYRVEMWGNIEGDAQLLGVTSISSVENSINIANIFAGYEDVKFPASCEDGGGGDTDTDAGDTADTADTDQ